MPLLTFLKLFRNIFLIFLIPAYIFSNKDLEFDGKLRNRIEYQSGFDIKSYWESKKDDFLLSRLRLNFKLNIFKELNFNLQIQDSRVAGTYYSWRDFLGGNNPYSDPFDINKFYLKYNFLKKFELKAGRQSISFGDRRIFGPGEWGNTGRYIWDAIRLRYENKNFESNLIYGSYVMHNPDLFPNKRVKNAYAIGSYNTYKFHKFNLDFFYVYQRDKRGVTKGEFSTGNLLAHYSGFRFFGKIFKFDVDTSIIKEWGNFGGDDINSYGIFLNIGYFLDENSKLNFQYVLGSGDKNPSDGKHNTFDGVYGGADTVLYGWMNLFYFKNLKEYRAEYFKNFSKKTSIKIEYHYFLLDEKKDGWYSPSKTVAREEEGKAGKNLGAELDIVFNHKYSKNFDILFGFSFFKPYEFVRKNFSNNIPKWYFFQSTIYF